MEAFTEHINAVDSNFKFTWEDVRGGSLPVLDCAVHTEEDKNHNTEVNRKPTYIDLYLMYPTLITHCSTIWGWS